MTTLQDLIDHATALGFPIETSLDDRFVSTVSGDVDAPRRPVEVIWQVSPETQAAFLSFSVTLPWVASDLTTALAAASIVNRELVFGTFQVAEDGRIGYRHGQVFDAEGTVTLSQFSALIQLVDYQQLHFGDYLEGPCAGRVSVEQLPRLIQLGETHSSAAADGAF